MSVIIRLQNLPWNANSLDIRQFFRNLAIPDGGVNIVGGEKGDAFIAFSTDEDARQAMMKNGGQIKETPVALFLSSRAEMQKTIEIARARTMSMMANQTATPAVTKPVATGQAPIVQPQPPVITMSGFLSQVRPTPSVGGIEIPGLTNGYTTTAASLLFNPNLPTNMPTIVDTTKPALITSNGLRRSASGSSRSRSRSPRRRSRSPRNRRRGRRSRSRSRERGRRHRSSSEDSYDSRRGIYDSSKPSYQSGSGVPAFTSNPRSEFNRMQMAHNNGERVDCFGRKIPEPGRDVFGREIRTNREEESNACIKLSGLDKNTGYGELRRLFTGMFITANGIKMMNDEFGERIGVACIRFARQADKETALARVNVIIRECEITISDIPDNEFEAAVDNFKPNVPRREREREAQKQADLDTDFTCIRVTDLPPYAKEQDIIKMFSSYTIMQIVMGRNSKKVHEAYVKFYRHDDAREALRSMPSCRIQHKIVHTSKCTDLEFEAARNEFELEVQLRQEEEERQEKEKLEKQLQKQREDDLEEKSREAKRRRFDASRIQETENKRLRESQIQPSAASRDPRSRDPRSRDPRKPPNYQTPTDSLTQASIIHASMTGQGLVPPPIPPSTVPPPGIVLSTLTMPGTQYPPMMMTGSIQKDPRQRDIGTDGAGSPGNGFNPRDPRRRADPRLQARQDSNSADHDCILMRNLPPQMGEWDVEEYLRGIGIHPDEVHLCVNAQNKPTGDGVCEFSTPEQARKAKKLESVNIGEFKVVIESISRADAKQLIDPNGRTQEPRQQMENRMQNGQRPDKYGSPQNNYDGADSYDQRFAAPQNGVMDMHRNGTGGRYGNGGPMYDGPAQQQQQQQQQQGMNNNNSFEGRVILLENIPYKAETEDILDFFGDGYNLTFDHVRRRFNERGLPAGEAKVLFNTVNDCQLAFAARKGTMLMNRKIFLKIHTDEDARQAMMKNGGQIKETPVALFLSSRAEMQKTIEIARARTMSMMANQTATPAVTKPVATGQAPIVQPQPPVITMSGFLSQVRPTPSVGGIEIPGLTNGYTTTAASLLFNPNLPTNMPTIVDTTKPALITSNGLRRSASGSSRSRSRSPRRRSRSPRNRRRGRRSRSRSRERGRRHRSSSEDSYDSRRGIYDSSKPSYQSGSGVPAFTSNPRSEFNRMQMAHNNGERVDCFGRKIPEPGRDVFGREIRTNREEESNACIKLSGLDKNTGYGELRRLFTGMFITANGIKMMNDEFGERIGVACIRFARQADKETALARVNVIIRECEITISDIPDNEFEAAVDNFKPNVPRREREREAQKQADLDTDFTCIRVTDLPPYAKEQDIIKMFSSYTIMQIVMGRNSKKVHEAYVKFYRHDDAREALRSMPSCRIQHKIVHTSKCTDLEFEAARNEFELEVQLRQEEEERQEKEKLEKQLQKQREDDLEEKSREAKRRRFDASRIQETENKRLRESQIQPSAASRDPRSRDPRSRDPRKPPNYQTPTDSLTQASIIHASMTGQGLVPPPIPPSTVPPPGIVLSTLTMPGTQYPPMMMTGSIQKDPRQRDIGTDGAGSPGNGFNPRDPRRRADPRLQARQDSNSADHDCILMRNLPPQMGEWDVEEYLRGIGIHPDEVHLCVNAQNKPTGDGVCEFSTPEQARKAKKLESVNIGEFKVVIESISRADAKQLIDPNGRTQEPRQQMENRMQNGQRPDKYGSPQNNYDGADSYDQRFAAPQNGVMDMHRNGTGGRYGNGGPMYDGPAQQQQQQQQQQGMNNNNSFEGRVILLENIPYKAETEDILDFFGDGYNLTFDHVRRRFNERGLPAGEAKVLFNTVNDCQLAFAARKGTMLMNRKIFLKIQ